MVMIWFDYYGDDAKALENLSADPELIVNLGKKMIPGHAWWWLGQE
jgi:hypothetical protein